MKLNNPNYLNGSRSSSSEIDGSVGITQEKNNLKYILTKLSLSTQVAIVGDSISHGAYATDIKNNSYVGLLKNLLNQTYNSGNYGFETIASSDTPGLWNSTMIHGFYSVGTVTTPTDTNTFSLNGHERMGVASTQFFFNIKDLKGQKKFRLNLIRHESLDCTYNVYVNNVLTSTETITSTGTTKDITMSSILDLANNGSNGCTIKVVISSGEMGIFGCTYYQNTSSFTLNNYSHSGRKTSYIKENVIKNLMMNNKVIFWNLGHNDAGVPDLTLFNTVMGWVYAYAIQYNTIVIFSDFLWTHSLENPVRIKNKEISTLLGKQSWYIDVPTSLTINNEIPTPTYLTTTLGGWADVSHPNDYGHRCVYTQIKTSLTL